MSDREVILVRQTVKAGLVDRLREWLASVRARTAEAVETLQAEVVRTKSTFLRETDEDTCLF